MKKLITFLLLLLIVSPVLAQTATPGITPTTTKDKQIEDLKDRIATKVAELSQTQRSAIFGKVKAVSLSTATIETQTKDIKIELTDDITIFQNIKGKRTELSIEDLAKDDVVTVFGEHDATLDLLKAKVIFIQGVLPIRTTGIVTDINKTNFTLTVKPPQGADITVDIEKFTKTTIWDGEDVAKGGFSKIVVGDTVHVTGTPVAKTENRISADRILDLGNQI
ncbi:hypothetical protein A3A79_00715 [Candidatus Gottesmanbacteria bacterium RIFCSPLOWO2_01_FULL_43_11b]|uniref:DUF5666 domain-containing protein n=1 Tax=Candidatus Gottesmanbacteria bacterium RIFCSPLOWO2_01_FULL_43_11b TaxID=1798392 RepID=A0A1F6AGB6_9BACT|nr:MAG: hypothetical protein A3A79_00715 [Candidatus Gottesmanbacteria bacterium RIFCSPLOWO2_01_FULL_43_11b]